MPRKGVEIEHNDSAHWALQASSYKVKKILIKILLSTSSFGQFKGERVTSKVSSVFTVLPVYKISSALPMVLISEECIVLFVEIGTNVRNLMKIA